MLSSLNWNEIKVKMKLVTIIPETCIAFSISLAQLNFIGLLDVL